MLVPISDSRSGSNVYFDQVKNIVGSNGIQLDLIQFAPYLEFAPKVAKRCLLAESTIGGCDLIHSNADYGVTFRRSDKPFIVTVFHDVFDENYQKSTTLVQKAYHFGLLKWRIARALKEADRVITISRSTRTSLERTFGVKNVEVIYIGIDTELFRPKKIEARDEFAAKTRLLFVGNLIKRKGADLLPAIMRKLGTDYVLFYTAGQRTQATFTEPNMVKRLAETKNDLVDLYNESDIFLFPSRLEGFGYAVGEAMACGKPIVCTDASSLPELVLDEQGGLLCRLNDVDDFVDKVRFLGARPELRQAMGEFNRKRIMSAFSISQMGTDYAALYQSFF